MAFDVPIDLEEQDVFVLRLKDARICLDCEILTVRSVCPKCDKGKTFSIGWWIHSMKEREVKSEPA